MAAVTLASLSACSPAMAPPSGLSADRRAELQDRIYRLGVGDKLKIVVFDEQELSGEFEVGATGNISMPLLGDVVAKGLTLDELSRAIRQQLGSGYLMNPKVAVQVLNYRAIYVHGEVRHGGEFGFKNGLTISDAVAMAGGYTYRAVTDYVVVRSEGSDKELTVPSTGSMAVLPGDNIRVPERFF